MEYRITLSTLNDDYLLRNTHWYNNITAYRTHGTCDMIRDACRILRSRQLKVLCHVTPLNAAGYPLLRSVPGPVRNDQRQTYNTQKRPASSVGIKWIKNIIFLAKLD